MGRELKGTQRLGDGERRMTRGDRTAKGVNRLKSGNLGVYRDINQVSGYFRVVSIGIYRDTPLLPISVLFALLPLSQPYSIDGQSNRLGL